MRRVSGWQAVVWVIVAGVVFLILATLLLWLALAIGVLGLVLWLHLVILPRLAIRLHLPALVLDALLLAVLVAGGWLLNELSGGIAGALLWVLGVGLPRLAGARLRQRVRVLHQRSAPEPYQGVVCPTCSLVSFGTERCPGCGVRLDRPPRSLTQRNSASERNR